MILTVMSNADMPDDDNVNSYAQLEVGGARKAKRKVVRREKIPGRTKEW